MKKSFSAVIQQEDDIYIATCPELDITSQGESLAEAINNLKEAVEVYLEEFPLNKESTAPLITTFEAEVPSAIAS